MKRRLRVQCLDLNSTGYSIYAQTNCLIFEQFMQFNGSHVKKLMYDCSKVDLLLKICSYCPNLEELSVQWMDFDCYVNHQTLLFLSLDCPYITNLKIYSIDHHFMVEIQNDISWLTRLDFSLNDVLQLWPNLKSIHLPYYSPAKITVSAIRLESITWDGKLFDTLYSHRCSTEEYLELLYPSDAPLKRIDSSIYTPMKPYVIKNLVISYPLMQEITLSIKLSSNEDFQQICNLLSSHCKNLRSLHLNLEFYDTDESFRYFREEVHANSSASTKPMIMSALAHLSLRVLDTNNIHQPLDLKLIGQLSPNIQSLLYYDFRTNNNPDVLIDPSPLFACKSALSKLQLLIHQQFDIMTKISVDCQNLTYLNLGCFGVSEVSDDGLIKSCHHLKTIKFVSYELAIFSFMASLFRYGHPALREVVIACKSSDSSSDVDACDKALFENLKIGGKICCSLRSLTLMDFSPPLIFWEAVHRCLPMIRQLRHINVQAYDFLHSRGFMQLERLHVECKSLASLDSLSSSCLLQLESIEIIVADQQIDLSLSWHALRQRRSSNKNRKLSSSTAAAPGFYPKLRQLCLRRCDEVDDAAIASIAQACPMLYSLSISSRSLTSIGLVAIAQNCQHLDRIRLGDCPRICYEGIASLRSALPMLRFEDLTNCSGLKRSIKPKKSKAKA
jgi:hypothetical protein